MDVNILTKMSSKSYVDGIKVDDSQSISHYDGSELKIISGENGNVKYIKLTNDDLMNLFTKPTEGKMLTERLLSDFDLSHEDSIKSQKSKFKTKTKSKPKTKSKHKKNKGKGKKKTRSKNKRKK